MNIGTIKIYAIREVNTGMYYSEKFKDIVKDFDRAVIFTDRIDAENLVQEIFCEGLCEPHWFTTLAAIERMYEKPILDIDIDRAMIRDTAEIFRFKVVELELKDKTINGNE